MGPDADHRSCTTNASPRTRTLLTCTLTAFDSTGTRPKGPTRLSRSLLTLWVAVLGFLALGLWQLASALAVRTGGESSKWAIKARGIAKAVVYLVLAWTSFSTARGWSATSPKASPWQWLGPFHDRGGSELIEQGHRSRRGAAFPASAGRRALAPDGGRSRHRGLRRVQLRALEACTRLSPRVPRRSGAS